jgi:hypothetical protein
VRKRRYIGRFRLPTGGPDCLTTSEITALGEIVEAYRAKRDTDAYLRAPGFVWLAAAYLHLLREHLKLLAGPEVH